MKKIDMHVHVIPDTDMEKLSGGRYPVPEEVRAIYDEYGIEKGVLLPPGCCPEGASERLGMREVRRMVQENNETLGWWFMNLDPRMGKNSGETDFAHFIRRYQRQGASGVGEVMAGIDLDDARMMALFRGCSECGVPITIHLGDRTSEYGLIEEQGLPRLEKVLQAFPKLKLIGHSLNFWREFPGGRIEQLMRKYPNLLCDTSSLSCCHILHQDPAHTYRFLDEFAFRVLYATDIADPAPGKQPMMKLSLFLDRAAAEGRILPHTYERVCRENALALLSSALC